MASYWRQEKKVKRHTSCSSEYRGENNHRWGEWHYKDVKVFLNKRMARYVRHCLNPGCDDVEYMYTYVSPAQIAMLEAALERAKARQARRREVE